MLLDSQFNLLQCTHTYIHTHTQHRPFQKKKINADQRLFSPRRGSVGAFNPWRCSTAGWWNYLLLRVMIVIRYLWAWLRLYVLCTARWGEPAKTKNPNHIRLKQKSSKFSPLSQKFWVITYIRKKYNRI